MIRLSVKGMAKFLTATAAGQRKILRDYKYPDEEGTAQAAYYREARDLIAEYHRKGYDVAWLDTKSAVLSDTAAALGGRVATRLRHNARALNEYGANFNALKLEVLAERKFLVQFGEVAVSVLPDLHVREKGRVRFIKLEFAKSEPSAEVIKIVSQIMYEAAVTAGLNMKSSDVLFIDVARGKRHKGARAGARLRRELAAAAQNIAAMWPTI